jgi:hypothetical protein
MILPTLRKAVISHAASFGLQLPGNTLLANKLMCLRGGAPHAALDLERLHIRIEGLALYGVIVSLMVNGALQIYGNTSRDVNTENDKITNYAIYAFKLLTAICVISGVYATLLFTLLCIYSYTALGAGLDESFRLFFRDTSAYRLSGFYAFLASACGFMGSFLLSLFLDSKGRLRYVILIPSLLLTMQLGMNLKGVMNMASQMIFVLKP